MADNSDDKITDNARTKHFETVFDEENASAILFKRCFPEIRFAEFKKARDEGIKNRMEVWEQQNGNNNDRGNSR